MKLFKKVLPFIITAFLLLSAFNLFSLNLRSATASAEMPQQFTYTDSGLDYTETQAQIINPDQGFYSAQDFKLPRSTASNPSFNLNPAQRGVYMVGVGLDTFSSRGGATNPSGQSADRADTELTSAALTTLENALKTFRNSGATCILRFSYDYNAKDNESFSGFESAEPQPASYGGATGKEAGMRLMEKHIEQVSGVLNNYLDVILSVQGGMFGPWGEQHSTDYGDTIEQNAQWYYRLNEAWLRNLHPSRGIGVRKPIYFAWWASIKYENPKITFATMKDLDYSTLPDGGADARRIGGWNDGYLGSPDDWGTYMSRSEEVAWLGKQAHNSFGGEAIVDSFGNPSIYSHPSRSIAEMFTTHTSYLNSAWNRKVHESWQGIEYDKDDAEHGHLYTDPVYNGTIGATVSSYDYIERHLGYRYVLRESKVSNGAAQGGLIKLNGRMENVGFGNSVNKRTTEIILKQGANIYQTEVSLDIQNVLSTKLFDYSVTLSLPNDMPAGDYEIFMKVRGADETPAILASNPAFRTVRFANKGANIWNSEIGANKIGSVSIASGSGANTDFEEVAFEDYNEIIRSEAVTGVWSDGSAGVLTANGEGIADATWTNAATISTSVTGYANKFSLNTEVEEEDKWYPCLAVSFVLKNPATVAVTLGGKVIVEAAQYPAGVSVIHLNDISESQAYKDEVAAKGKQDSFTFGFNLSAGTENRMYIKWISFYDELVHFIPRFNIRFNGNGGTLVSGEESQRVLLGGNAVAPVYEREGYVFNGWNLSTDNITREKLIFAIWREVGAEDIVIVYVDSITLDKTELSMNAGDEEVITATVGPTDANNKAVIWTSSNENIAVVDQNGKVHGSGNGTAQITATAADGSGVFAEATVTVAKPEKLVEIVDKQIKKGCNADNSAMAAVGVLSAALLFAVKFKRL